LTEPTLIALTELYETDFVLWTEKIAELLQQKNYGAVDWENVIEEIESMGRSERRASEREGNARHWLGEIATFRSQLKKEMKTATIANHARGCFGEVYTDAREILISAGYLKKSTIPVELPFSLEQVLDFNWFPINVDEYRDGKK
jgi:hypothetical protein